jgi:exoribonuclease II
VEKGTLIEFREQGERRLAVVDRPDGKKDWIVIDRAGSSLKLRPQRVDYTIGSPYKHSDIPSFLQGVEPYLDPENLALAWELLVEAGETVTPSQMAQILFSSQSPEQCYAAHVLLSQDRIYFKNKGEVYEPRSVGQVEEIKHQIEVEGQRQQEKEGFYHNLKAALAGEKVFWSEFDRTRLETLEKFVLAPETPSRNAQDILSQVDRPNSPEAAFQLLIDLGWWSKHENLFLRRSSYPVSLPKKVLDLAQYCLQSPPVDPDADRRLDLTHLKVYTIDDESTEEIDDGLSIEYQENGNPPKIWIHIADPSHLVNPDDELDLEARRRSTTLYLPTGMIPMFPSELATGPMSLVQGKVCPALSFCAILDDSGAVVEYSIHPSWVKPTYRLTYQDVDEMLLLGITAEPEISDLALLSKKRKQWRKEQGSIEIAMPEATIKVKDNEEISIELVENPISRRLVAEMMIMTGEIAGHYGQTHSLPLPFRGQPQPELPSDEELILLPAGPVRSCALRRCMPRSEMWVTPARHAGLGLNTYVQATSPIRRYTDLLAHFQIKAHLRGESLPYSSDRMQEIVYSVTAASQEATLVERQTNRYWSLEYLRRHADETWQVLVLRWLREDENLGLILLEEIGLELPHRFERAVELGDRLHVRVTRSDPHRDEIRFREMLLETEDDRQLAID